MILIEEDKPGRMSYKQYYKRYKSLVNSSAYIEIRRCGMSAFKGQLPILVKICKSKPP